MFSRPNETSLNGSRAADAQQVDERRAPGGHHVALVVLVLAEIDCILSQSQVLA